MATPQNPPQDIAVVVLLEFGLSGLPGAWWRFLFARFNLYRTPGLRFAKVMGSGHEGGFGLRPSLSRHGLFCVFVDDEAADRFLASKTLTRWHRSARRWSWLKLQAYSSRGRWSGHEIAASTFKPDTGPVVSLTRASIRPARALPFWRLAPPAEQSLATSEGCRMAVGLGEAPVLRQATLSIWESASAMDAYARSGAHLRAIQTAYREEHFAESMFIRWRLLGEGGSAGLSAHG